MSEDTVSLDSEPGGLPSNQEPRSDERRTRGNGSSESRDIRPVCFGFVGGKAIESGGRSAKERRGLARRLAVESCSAPTDACSAMADSLAVLELRARADAAKARGDAVEGTRWLGGIVAVAPDDAAAWRDLGIARVELADPRGAIEAFEKAVSLAPKDADLRRRFGLALEAVDALDDAAYQL